MKRFFFLILTLAVALGALAQKEEARYNYIDRTITRQADGSTLEQIKSSLTIFTHLGANYNYGQTYIVFNPKFQEVKINEAYTVQKDGRRVDLPERAVQDVLPSCAAKAADFNYLIERVVVHTGIEVGCTVFLDYSILSKPGFNKNLDLTEPIDLTAPISEYRLRLNVPKTMALRHLLTSPAGSVAPLKDEENGLQRTIEYALKNIPARSKDAYQVKDMTQHYNLLTTASDFETELKEFFFCEIDPDLKLWGEDIVLREPDGRKRFNQIRKYVAEEFELVPVPLALVDGLRSFKSFRAGAYLTQYEQAALLNQMLLVSNIRSEVKAVFDPSLPKEFRTLSNALRFVVSHQFGEQEVVVEPSKAQQNANATLMVGLDGERLQAAKPLEIEKTYELSVGAANLKDGYCILELPQNQAGVSGWGMNMLPTLREVDFEIPALLSEQEVYKIKVEDGLQLHPSSLFEETICDKATGAQLSANLSRSAEDATLTLTLRIELPKKIYTVEEYPAVREILMKWSNPNLRRLLFTAQ